MDILNWFLAVSLVRVAKLTVARLKPVTEHSVEMIAFLPYRH